jgi:hypothetical protein
MIVSSRSIIKKRKKKEIAKKKHKKDIKKKEKKKKKSRCHFNGNINILGKDNVKFYLIFGGHLVLNLEPDAYKKESLFFLFVYIEFFSLSLSSCSHQCIVPSHQRNSNMIHQKQQMNQCKLSLVYQNLPLYQITNNCCLVKTMGHLLPFRKSVE